jgi:hypothetical protein
MGIARIVLAQGLVNGSNRVFATGEPYVAGSVALIVNGLVFNQLTPGTFTELSPEAGTIEAVTAPVIGDVVQLLYTNRKIVAPPAVTRLAGVVDEPNKATGVVRPSAPERLSGVVRAEAADGVVRTPSRDRLAGVVRVARVTGVIREKC